MSQDREERLQQYMDGHLDAAEREALAEAAQARRAPFQPKRRPQAVVFLAVAFAASTAFVAFILPRPGGDDVFRGEDAGAPRAIQPVGELEGPPHMFIWSRDPGAALYRLEIFNAEGTRLHVTTTADTFLATRGGIALPRAGSWRATTLDSVGIEVRSTGDVGYSFP